MYKCPNKNLPEWKELERVVPEVAYTVWDLNNGHGIDKAPNGEPSILFQDLLDHFDGDREEAIKTKVKVFTNEFKNWFNNRSVTFLKQDNGSIDYLFSTNPELEKVGTKDEYKQYLNTIFPNSKVSEVYWHGTDSDFSEGIQNTKKGKGSGAPETKKEMYFNRQPWASLQYISGINRKIPDKDGYNNWVKLWWELKEILGNGRMQNDDWKSIVIGPDIRQEIPNKKGVFNRNEGGENGSFLKERKARYGYENKSDKEFFEEVFGIRYGKDTFQDWVNNNANIFRQIWNTKQVKKGMYPVLLNIQNPIVEQNQNTYYEEERKLMTSAKQNNNDSIISNSSKNEFNSDVIVMLYPQKDVHILGTYQDIQQFKEWKKTSNASKIVDENGEPLLSELLSSSTVTYNPEDFTPIPQEDMRVINEVTKLYEKIQKGLKDRLNSIKRYTVKNPKVWNQLQTTIQQLANSETEEGIYQFLQHIDESINDSIKFLSKPTKNISAKQIRQLSNDYIGFYKPLMDDIIYLFDTTDIFKDKPNYDTIKELANTLSQQIDSVNNKFINVLKSKGYSMLQQYLTELGMPQNMIQDTINWLDDPKHDSSLFMDWFGMSSNSNNAVQQIIAKLLNDTKNATDRETMEVGIKLVKLVNAAKEKYGNDVQKLLYEKLDDGTYSGNKVSPLNNGQLKRDQRQFMDKLAEKLGISKDNNNMYVLPQNEDIQKKWFDELTKWYADRAQRRYKAEYYILRNKMLSMKTRDAEREIQSMIDGITQSMTINGIQYENLLTEAEYKQLESLRKQKRLLSNIFNIDGSEKTGIDRVIADELTAFHEEVNKHIKYDIDKDKYEKDLAKVIERYGGETAEVQLWKQRNTVTRYTQDFYDRIANLESDSANKDPESTYQKLRNRRRQLQNLYKDPHTNKIDINSLSDDEKRSLLQLDQDIANAYTATQKTEGADKFSNFAEIVNTEQYYHDMEQARNAGVQAYNEWFNNNHYEDVRGFMHPASYYTELRPLPEFAQQYTETVPSSKYSKILESSEWYNPEFDENGPAIQPNKKYYDNSKAYNEVMNKPEVKELYDEITNTMNEAMSFISFLTNSNENMMPQIEARFMQVLNRKDGILNKLKYAVEDFAITKEDDLDFVKEFSTMPNGDPIKVIPTRFITPLEDTNSISTDAVSAVVQFYNMAANYKNMSAKQDEIELMLNLLKQLSIRTSKELKGPGSTNVYKQSQLLVDRLMYGRNKTPIEGNVLGYNINFGKALDIVRGFVTKVNLSGNLWSIGTSFFTDATYTTLEAKMGRYFDLEDLNFAKSEFARELPNMMQNIGNPNPKGRLPYLLMLNQVVKDNKELFDRLDQSQVLRSINQNFWFAGYTQSDYTVKSHTLLSIYHNYRLVDNEGFMSKQQYIDKFYSNDRKKGAVEFKQLTTTLYDAYIELPNGDVVVDDKYKSLITDKLLNDVRNRIEIISKRIDGTIREVDKAAVHANAMASYLVLHRNFMISALHDRFKPKQYNLDLQTIEEGYYRSTGRFLKNIIANRHFAIKQLLADYNNMQEYEQYAVRRVLNELVLIAASTVVALTIASIVDGDDDYDTWLTQSITYLAMRSAFEFRTMYNPFEFMALIKSPTAAFNWFDNISSFINLINPASYIGDRTPFTIIDRGVYKGMPVILKNIIKVTPFKSIIEAQDPKSKRNYLQNQLMNF